MSRCRLCGAKIKWIEMRSGNVMSVDAIPITFKSVDPKLKYAKIIVLEDGTVTTGYFDPNAYKTGYTSHFTHCPKRRNKRWRMN